MTVPELARFAVGRASTSSRSPITTRSATTRSCRPPRRAHGITLVPGQEVTVQAGHANALGDMGWIDFREPADAWLDATRAGRRPAVGQPPDRRARELDASR